MERYIDSMLERLEQNKEEEFHHIANDLFLDCLNELKNLEGEAFVRCAVEVIKVIETVDYLKS